MEKFKVLDIFSGIGGFSLGLERTGGFETTAFCEIDENARNVLKKHWPEVIRFKNIKDLKPKKGDYDVVCGGFPCQDISVAGLKKGMKGERSGLWTEFKRIIKEVEPRYAIIENVANLRNLGLTEVIKNLWSIGYVCEWHIIPARSVGSCHLRERIWIIAYPHSTNLWQQSRRWQRSSGKEETQSREFGENGSSSNTGSKRLQGRYEQPSSGKTIREQRLSFSVNNLPSENYSNTDMPRLWKPFSSEKEKSEWWSKATSSFRNWWKIESSICRVDDGLPKGLDKARRERIKQLGNSVVPQIPELIGSMILDYERGLNEK